MLDKEEEEDSADQVKIIVEAHHFCPQCRVLRVTGRFLRGNNCSPRC